MWCWRFALFRPFSAGCMRSIGIANKQSEWKRSSAEHRHTYMKSVGDWMTLERYGAVEMPAHSLQTPRTIPRRALSSRISINDFLVVINWIPVALSSGHRVRIQFPFTSKLNWYFANILLQKCRSSEALVITSAVYSITAQQSRRILMNNFASLRLFVASSPAPRSPPSPSAKSFRVDESRAASGGAARPLNMENRMAQFDTNLITVRVSEECVSFWNAHSIVGHESQVAAVFLCRIFHSHKLRFCLRLANTA